MSQSKKNILVLGATSDIARACCELWAKQGTSLHLVARNSSELKKTAQDLRIRFSIDVVTTIMDANNPQSRHDLLAKVNPDLSGVLLAYGVLGSQEASQKDETLREQELQANFNSAVHLLEPLAAIMEARQSGFIIGIGSVAGDRGRASNYIYGAAKAGFAAYLSGLRNRLSKSNVQVLTVKPGFVNTKMTQGLPLPKPLVASPHQVAQDILKAVSKKRDVIYTRWFWKYIMRIIIHIPEGMFKRMSL